MTTRSFLTELHRRNPVLSYTGWFHLAVLLGALVGITLDTRQVLGINPWIKPAKFAISIAAYAWTMAWILKELPEFARAVRWISNGIAITMVVEIVCICFQSYRGVASHYNISSSLNGSIFALMGFSILANTALMILVLGLYFRQPPRRAAAYTWGIRTGILIFVASGFIGNAMIQQMSHTVGGDDGGPGLPLVNWSATAGDLRIAHALGLHALQLLPLIGFILSRSTLSESYQKAGIWIGSLLYAALTLGLYMQALAGRPLTEIGIR